MKEGKKKEGRRMEIITDRGKKEGKEMRKDEAGGMGGPKN